MSAFQKLFKQTFIYGLATVLPRMLSFILVPLYTSEAVLPNPSEYGQVSVIFSYFVLFNVLLAYGMETAFFRFINKVENKLAVINTASISLVVSSIVFFVLAYLFQDNIAKFISIEAKYIRLVIWILLLDALVIIPFAWLRANEKPSRYAIIKILNVSINIGLNLFFLLALKSLADSSKVLGYLYRPNHEISYIFIANLIASGFTLLFFIRFYRNLNFQFDKTLWKQMMRYALPVLIAGIAFSINETFDRILLKELLPHDIADNEIGMYSACYKLALFMTLFATAFRLGIEPYFFSHSNTKNPQKNYALILEYFVAFGSVILLAVVVLADFIKPIVIRSEAYWEAMTVVPIVLLANFCLGIYHNLSVWYKITDRTKIGAYISIIGAVITLIVNMAFISTYSYMASAFATLAAYATMMVISYSLGRKYYPIPYNLRKMGLYMCFSIGLSILSFYYYRGNYVIGITMLIVFLALVIYLEKNQVKQLIKGKI